MCLNALIHAVTIRIRVVILLYVCVHTQEFIFYTCCSTLIHVYVISHKCINTLLHVYFIS